MKNEVINNLIILAIMKAKVEEVKLLLENNPQIPLSSSTYPSLLLTAITLPVNRNDFQCAALLIDHDADLSIHTKLDIEDRTFESHLHWITKRMEPHRLHIINAIIRHEERNKKELMKVLVDAKGKTPFDYLHKSYHGGTDYQAYYDTEKTKYIEAQKATEANATQVAASHPITALLSAFSSLFSSPSRAGQQEIRMNVLSKNEKSALKLD